MKSKSAAEISWERHASYARAFVAAILMAPIMLLVIHSVVNIDDVEEQVRKELFDRNVNRPALPKSMRPVARSASIKGSSNTRSFASAVANWFGETEYPERWKREVKKFENAPLYEGVMLTSSIHQDKLRPGITEVGYGITNAEIYEAKRLGLLPHNATLPKKMSKEEADKWFEEITIPTYEKCVEEIVNVPLTCEQKFALISFCHNLGKGNLLKMAMKPGRLTDSNYAVIADSILLYTNAGNCKDVAGLVRRRAWESDLWRSGTNDYSRNPKKMASR